MNMFGNLNENVQSKFAQYNSQLEKFMMTTNSLFQSCADDAEQRETDTREYVNKATADFHNKFQQDMQSRDRESQIMAKDQLALTSQVNHLTRTVTTLREQISAQADFAVDAIQQVRDEASIGERQKAHCGSEWSFQCAQNACHSTNSGYEHAGDVWRLCAGERVHQAQEDLD